MDKKAVLFNTEQVTKNFQLYEFFIASRPQHTFIFPVALMQAAQIIRDWVGFETDVTSTSRPADPFGYHRYDAALDLCTPYVIHGVKPSKTPEQILEAFKTECMNYINGKGSQLIDKLRKAGVNGFGVECGCIHMDVRPDHPLNRKDSYGTYCVFEFKCHYNKKGEMIIDINRAL